MKSDPFTTHVRPSRNSRGVGVIAMLILKYPPLKSKSGWSFPASFTWFLMTLMASCTPFVDFQLEREGKRILENKCTSCHDLDSITESRFTQEEWANEVDAMIAMGADVTPDERTVLVDYLAKTLARKN